MTRSHRLLVLVSLSSPALAQGVLDVAPACAAGVRDAAQPTECLPASSVPTPGTLLPLGPFLWVEPTGEVGLGTQAPTARLDVAGDLRADGRLALGNDASFGAGPGWDRVADLSWSIDQFDPGISAGVTSTITYRPPHDLTGADETWLWAQYMEALTEPSNDRDVEALFGPGGYAHPFGSGTYHYVAAMGGVAENDNGLVLDQSGAAFTSGSRGNSSIQRNQWLYLSGGHWGTGGSIQHDYGIYVDEPYSTSPLKNHYGLYLANQDHGVEDSYAIYSEGGATYLGGDLGVHTPTPAAALDVAGDFVASGTKSFRQDDPLDPSREIWFVCLEGNEAGTYFRGSVRLAGGRAEIPVPEEFALVTESAGLTVQVTALGDARVWVEHKGLDGIVVRGDADVELDYFVNGVRAGYAGFQPLRAKPMERTTGATVPREERAPWRELGERTRAGTPQR